MVKRLTMKGLGVVMGFVLALSALLTGSPQSASASSNQTFIDNGSIKLGVDLDWGGGIAYLGKSGSGYPNMVNQHDNGRLIQQSYYGDAEGYGTPQPGPISCTGAFNPVQGGDINGNNSGVIRSFNNGSLIYVKTQPLDWCHNNKATPTYMENWYTVSGNTVKVENRFTYFGTTYQRFTGAELPAIYTNTNAPTAVYYKGSAPFTGAATTSKTISTTNDYYFASEYWSSVVDGSGNAMGWYLPNLPDTIQMGHNSSSSGNDLADPTNYFTANSYLNMYPGFVYKWNYYLAAGSVSDVRNMATSRHYLTASSWDFNTNGDREMWSINKNADGSGPSGGIWYLNVPSSGIEIHAPYVTIPAERKNFEIRLRNNTGASFFSVIFRTSDGGYGVANVPISSNNAMTTYTFDMSAVNTWAGEINSIHFQVWDNSGGAFDIDYAKFTSGSGTAPTISNVSGSAFNDYLAQVTFNTNVGATSQVEYGTTTSYGSKTPDDITLETAHTVYLSDLSAGTTYHYRIITRDAQGNVTTGSDNTFTTTGTGSVPSAPTGLTATGGNAQVALNWSASSGAASYTVKRSTTNGGPYATTVASGLTSTSYTDTTVTNGTTYYYVVTASNGTGESGNSGQASATPSSGGGTSAIEWNFNTDGNFESWWLAYDLTGSVSGGSLNLTSTGGDPYMYSPDNLGVAASNSHIVIRMKNDTSNTEGKIFFTTNSSTNFDEAKSVSFTTTANSGYTVYDVDMSGNTNWTGTIKRIRIDPLTTTGTVQIDYIKIAGSGSGSAPAAPTGLSATGGNGQVALSWNASSGATSYTVKRGTSSGGPYATTVASGLTGTSYTDTSVTNGTTYYYVVTAANGSGESGNSLQSSATPSSGGGTSAIEWNFNTDGDLEGWWLANDLTGSVSGGALNLTSTGGDPYMYAPDNLGIAASNTHIVIRMKNDTSNTEGKIFFITNSSTNFDEAKSVSFTTTANSGYTVYDINMGTNANWTGTIKRIRIDPLTTTGTVQIDYIKITN